MISINVAVKFLDALYRVEVITIDEWIVCHDDLEGRHSTNRRLRNKMDKTLKKLDFNRAKRRIIYAHLGR